MAYDPGRIGHFQIGAYSHQHVLHLGNAQAITSLHGANARIEARKTGKGITASLHNDKQIGSFKDRSKAEDNLHKNTTPSGEVLGVVGKKSGKALPSKSYEEGVGLITHGGRPDPNRVREN